MNELCESVHRFLAGLHRCHFPFSREEIASDGVYILFEKGEKAHGTDRIVRIGTHTGDHNLPLRLLEHFVNENKDRSIFRKNIGRAFLEKNNDPFQKQWEWDLTSSEAKQIYSQKLDNKQQAKTEKRITRYIQSNLSFTVVPVKSKKQRLDLESCLIALVAQCNDCKPSKGWLGLHSPIPAIKDSGLWQRQGLKGNPLTEGGFKELREMVRDELKAALKLHK